MSARTFAATVLLACASACQPKSVLASAANGELCLAAAERIDAGETLTPAEKEQAQKACGRAISATASIFQKYQFEEAYFAVTGRRFEY